jgi:hypothetical protein
MPALTRTGLPAAPNLLGSVSGPPLPALTVQGLAYVRDDLLARAAGAEQQEADAWAAGNVSLAQRCGGTASACRDAARQIVRYALDPAWSVQP